MPSGDPLPLSVAIVCKNNEGTIGRTLESVRGLAGEIVAVDSGSTDGTIPLLESHGAKIVRSDWLGFVRTKQKALEACGEAWILSVDSDESVEPELGLAIRSVIEQNDPAVVAARLNRRVWYRGAPLRHVWQPEWRLRLVRNGKAAWGGLDPHDKLSPTVPGTVLDLQGGEGCVLRHDSFETFQQHFATQVRHATLMAKSVDEAGEAGTPGLLRPITSCIGAVVKQVVLKGAWRDGRAGWLAAYSTGLAALVKHASRIERGLDEADPGTPRKPADPSS